MVHQCGEQAVVGDFGHGCYESRQGQEALFRHCDQRLTGLCALIVLHASNLLYFVTPAEFTVSGPNEIA